MTAFIRFQRNFPFTEVFTTRDVYDAEKALNKIGFSVNLELVGDGYIFYFKEGQDDRTRFWKYYRDTITEGLELIPPDQPFPVNFIRVSFSNGERDLIFPMHPQNFEGWMRESFQRLLKTKPKTN